MALEDPFFVVKAEVETALGAVNLLRENWRRLLNTTNTDGNDEFNWTSEELKNSLKNIEYDLQDLEETISIVESNPHKFKLDAGQLRSRKQFISDTRSTIQDIRSEMSSPQTKAKLEKDKRDSLMKQKSKQALADKFAKLDKEREMDNQEFIDTHNPQMLMAKQDEQLDGILTTVKSIKNTATVIGTELDDQKILLDDLDENVSHASSKLKSAMQKMNKIYKDSKENKSLCCIVFLVIVIVILGILALTI